MFTCETLLAQQQRLYVTHTMILYALEPLRYLLTIAIIVVVKVNEHVILQRHAKVLASNASAQPP